MAKEVVQRLLDDMEEGRVEAEGTIDFGLDGKFYEMELSSANMLKLRSLLAPWIANARPSKPRRQQGRTSRSTTPRTAGSDYSREQRDAIRSWAQSQGMGVSDRGRLSGDVIKAYELAHAG